MKKQSGIIGTIQLIVLAVAVAAFLSLWAYYRIQVSALEGLVEDKQSAIDQLAKEKAECGASKVALEVVNKDWSAQVTKQNEAIGTLKIQRDIAKAAWTVAKKEAEKNSKKHRSEIGKLRASNVRAGETWCKAAERSLDGYYQRRKAQ